MSSHAEAPELPFATPSLIGIFVGTLNPQERLDVDHVARLQIPKVTPQGAQTGISQADAEKRLNETIADAKAAADRARRAAAQLAFWLTAALLFGAFAASLAAVEGGQLRDGTWSDRRLVKRPW